MNGKCGAASKRSKQPCKAPAMKNGRCHKHGGATPSGLAHPNTVTGRYSKHLPTRLVARYQEAVSDPELLALKDEIGLLDTRIGGVVAALNTGESKEAWVLLSSAVRALTEQWSSLLDDGEPPEDMERTIEELAVITRDGLSESYVWAEIRGLLKERAELVANERKRLVELQQYVTTEKALLFVHAVMASVKRHVSDRSALAAISADLARLSDVRNGSEPALA